jgi:hypothetical protein
MSHNVATAETVNSVTPKKVPVLSMSHLEHNVLEKQSPASASNNLKQSKLSYIPLRVPGGQGYFGISKKMPTPRPIVKKVSPRHMTTLLTFPPFPYLRVMYT